MFRPHLACVLILACVSVAPATVVPIGPFVGDLSDPLNYPGTAIVARFNLFGGAGDLRSVDGTSTYIHYLISDSLSGDLVTPRTGGHILGFTQGPGVFEFNPPVQRFGAYFNNNSGQDNARVDFRDAGGTLLDTLTATTIAAGNVWTWNGWQSSVPISSISVTGNGVINGFLWFDDLEIGYVPEPATATLLACFGAGLIARSTRWRRRFARN